MSNYTNYFFKRLVVVLVFLLSFNASAQLNNFPVTCTPFFVPQYNLQWNNFYTSSNFLKINLYLKDNKQGGDVNVFLRFRLERVGVSIINSPDFIATKPIKLSFGSLQTLTGIDISENFLPQNLLLQGISEDFVRNGGSLPDGLWTIYVTAYEADGSRGYRQISNEGVGQTMVFYGQPPMLLSPGNGSEIDNSFSPNVLFNWLPRAGAMVGGLTNVAYKFQLWELDTEEDPNEVSAGKNEVFSSIVSSPMYLYDATKPFLVPGKRYAWRVRVIEATGENKFENDGYSEVWSFRYGLLCGEVKKIALSPIGGRFYRLAWESVKNSNKYEINWRVKGGSSWTVETSIENRFDFQLDDSQNYEFKVRSLCRNGETGAWSEVLEWSKDVVNTSKSSATGTSTTPSPQNNFPKVLNPSGTTVTSSNLTPEQIKATKDEYDKAPVYKLNRCGMPVKSTTASCEVDQSISYAGSIPFQTPPLATKLYFNSYEIVVTSGNAAEGQGLLFFPYLMKRIPVEWKNITIRKGEDPEDPLMKDFGCIVGPQDKIQVQGSDASVLSDDLNKQFTALAAWLNDPGSFTGTFGEAIELMKKLAEKLSTGKTIDPADLKEFKNACKAVNKGTDQWINQIKTIVGTHPSKETTELLASISSAKLQVLEMLDCGNANATPPTPKKGPSWDDNFLLEECDYEKAKSSAGELTKQSDNSKGIFTPPPTDKLTCLVKLSDLKKQLNVTISTFLCPDGGLINLDDADEIKFYAYDKSLYPNGSIIGVKKGTKNYIARIITYTSAFTGFVDWDIWKSQGHPPDPAFHSTAPELNKSLSVWAIELNESEEVRSIGKADYSTQYYKQGEVSIIGRNRLNYGMDQAASSCNFKSNSTDSPVMEGYSSQSGLDDLTKKLKKYGGLGDVIFKITDKDGKVSYVTKDKQYKPNEGTPTGTNGSGKTTFEITEDANGKVDVKGKFKADPGCPNCAGEAEKALNAAIAEMATKHGGKIDPKKNVIESQTLFPEVGGLSYSNMSLAEALCAMAKGYNEILDKSKVPQEVWEPNKEFPVREPYGIISGSIDGVASELKDKAQLVGMGLTVISNPTKTAKDLVAFGKNLDWQKAGGLAKGLAGGLINFDASEFEKGGAYTGHATGGVIGSVTFQAATGGMALLTIVKGVPDKLDNLAAKIAILLNKLKGKLKDASLLSKLEDDLANTKLLDALEADNDLVNSWEVLQRNGRSQLKLIPDALQALNKLRKNQKLIEKGVPDDILGKMQGFKIPPQDFSYVQICDKVGSFVDDLPMDNVDKAGLERFLGTSNLGNANSYTVRHGVLGMDVVGANKGFLGNADKITFENKFTDLPYQAEADLFFTKTVTENGISRQKSYIGEFKAGETFFTDNFADQCKSYFNKVTDLQGLRIFSRPEVAVSKAQIITKWKNGGVLGNTDALSKFNDYKANILRQPGTITELNFENFLNSNDDWFNMIFNSNF